MVDDERGETLALPGNAEVSGCGESPESTEAPCGPATAQAAQATGYAEVPNMQANPMHSVDAADHSTSVPLGEADGQAASALQNLEARRRKKRRGRIVKIAVVLAIAVAAVCVWLFRDALFPSEEMEMEPATAIVERGDFITAVQGSGSLNAGSTVVVAPEVDGIITKVNVVEGQQVKKGDVLLELRNADLDKAVSDASDQVSAASSEVAAAQTEVADLQAAYEEAVKAYNAELKKAEKDKKKAKKAGDAAYQKAYDAAMAAIPEGASEEERARLKAAAKETAEEAYQKAYEEVPITEVVPVDEASYISQIDSAKGAVASAQNGLSTAQGAYDQAVEQAGKRQVKAPASGVVLALTATEGAAVGAAEGGTSASARDLMQIADLNKMQVNIEVNEIDISSVKEGQKASVTFAALPDLELEASVVSVASVASGAGETGMYDGGSGVVTFTVGLEIGKPDPRLKPGMTTSVEIKTQDEQDVLLVPASALMDGPDEHTAYVDVVTDEESLATETREVTVGLRSSSQAVIEAGLAEGDMVLLGGWGGMDDMVDGDMPAMSASMAG